ncbi:MAG: ERCC4 domain-containing protein [Nanoarchaeota archaeon]
MTFYNIFSKKKNPEENKETKEKQTIIIDNREKQSLVPSELTSLNFQLKFEQLQVGDYLVNNTIIERKTFADLQSSIINKRIFEQLSNLKDKQSLLIIEGKSNLFIHENALRGFLLSLATEFKVPFVFSKDEKDTALFISVLARKEKKEISLRFSPKLQSKSEIQQFILEGFPNIGPSTAKALLKEFKSLSAIFTANEEQLKPILKSKTKDFKDLLS